MVLECPKCGIVNPPTAVRCDCGYGFQALDPEAPVAPPVPRHFEQIRAVGLLLVGVGVLIHLAFTLAEVANEFRLLGQRDLMTVFFYGGLAVSTLVITGYGLCLTCPREVGRKIWLITAAGLFAAAVVGQFAEQRIFRWLLEVDNARLALIAVVYFATSILLLKLVALAFFLVWVRSLALNLQSAKRTKQALDLIKTGTVIALIFLGPLVCILLREPPYHFSHPEITTVGSVLSGIITGAAIGLLIWLGGLARLLLGLQWQLQSAIIPAQRKAN